MTDPYAELKRRALARKEGESLFVEASALLALLADLDKTREEVDGPSGLREQLEAARKGEQIEFRMRTAAQTEVARLKKVEKAAWGVVRNDVPALEADLDKTREALREKDAAMGRAQVGWSKCIAECQKLREQMAALAADQGSEE